MARGRRDDDLSEEEYMEEEEVPSHSEEEEDDEESDDDDDGTHEIPTDKPRPDAIYDASGLNEKLGDFAWAGNVGWIHSLEVTKVTDRDVDVEDDLAREMSFYTLALDGAKEAYEKLQGMKVPFLRPEDYYAEMVKTDSHMHKVKGVLVNEQKKLEEQQERRKAREAKKFSKEVQAEKMKERNKQKKQDIESVKKWRKMRQDSGFSRGEDELPLDLGGGSNRGRGRGNGGRGDGDGNNKRKRGASSAPWDRSGGRAGGSGGRGGRGGGSGGRGGRGGGFGGRGGFNKRQQRDTKFGNGRRKGMMKKNTAASSADTSGYDGRQKKQRRN